MQIRKARMMDKEEIYEMLCKTQECTLDKNMFEQIFWENTNRPYVDYIVAIKQDTVIAFASLHVQTLLHQLGMIGEIQEFCTLDNKCTQEIKDALFVALKKRAMDVNCVQLRVSKQRVYKDGIGFYETHAMVNMYDTWILDLR